MESSRPSAPGDLFSCRPPQRCHHRPHGKRGACGCRDQSMPALPQGQTGRAFSHINMKAFAIGSSFMMDDARFGFPSPVSDRVGHILPRIFYQFKDCVTSHTTASTRSLPSCSRWRRPAFIYVHGLTTAAQGFAAGPENIWRPRSQVGGWSGWAERTDGDSRRATGRPGELGRDIRRSYARPTSSLVVSSGARMPWEAWFDLLDCDLSVVILRGKCADHSLDPQCLRQSFEWSRECIGCPFPVRLESASVFANHDPCRLPHKSRSCAKVQLPQMTCFNLGPMSVNPLRQDRRIHCLSWKPQLHLFRSNVSSTTCGICPGTASRGVTGAYATPSAGSSGAPRRRPFRAPWPECPTQSGIGHSRRWPWLRFPFSSPVHQVSSAPMSSGTSMRQGTGSPASTTSLQRIRCQRAWRSTSATSARGCCPTGRLTPWSTLPSCPV